MSNCNNYKDFDGKMQVGFIISPNLFKVSTNFAWKSYKKKVFSLRSKPVRFT